MRQELIELADTYRQAGDAFRMRKLLFTTTLALATALSAPDALSQHLRLLVGTYTENTSAEGVYLYSFEPESADTRLLGMAPSGNPSFVIASPDGRYAFSVNEFGDGRQGVSSFALGENSIAPISSVPIPKEEVDGEDPCNLLLLDDTLISSNYTGGSVSVFGVERNAELTIMTQSFSTGKEFSNPLSGKKVSVEKAHMHCAVPSPDGKYIFVTNLGMDCIHRFVRNEGIHPLGNASIAWQNRSLVKYGPRHMVFSADGRFAYLLCELGDKLMVFSYTDGTLTPIQTLNAYGGKGHGSADIHLSPDGRHLYTSHRLKDDGIAVFYVDPASGKVEKAGYQPTGKHPRNFAISPDGRFLLCACRDDNRIEVYSINNLSGELTPTGKSIEVGSPVCIQFLEQ